MSLPSALKQSSPTSLYTVLCSTPSTATTSPPDLLTTQAERRPSGLTRKLLGTSCLACPGVSSTVSRVFQLPPPTAGPAPTRIGSFLSACLAPLPADLP